VGQYSIGTDNRALNLLSHGKYAIYEPTDMGDDNKDLFRRILRDFVTTFQFALPDIVQTPPAAAAPAAVAAPALAPTS
jgi:hypothetical protein